MAENTPSRPVHRDPAVQARINACYEGCHQGHRVCAGCSNDLYCQMGRESYRWLTEKFLPKIDPGGTVFGHPLSSIGQEPKGVPSARS